MHRGRLNTAAAYTMTILGGAASLIIATLMGVVFTRGIAVPITRMTGSVRAAGCRRACFLI